MGYVCDKAFAQFIPPGSIVKTAGTWTPTLAANTIGDVRTAAGAGFNLFVPLQIPSNAENAKGCRILSVELLFKIATLAMTSVTTVELEKVSVSAAGVVSGSAAAVTLDAGNDTSAERAAVGDHRMLVSVDAPAWIDNDEVYWLYVTFVAQATTAFTLWGAIVNYELRA